MLKRLIRWLWPEYVPQRVDVGRATVTVNFPDDLPDVIVDFEGYANHSPAFGLFTTTAEGMALAWVKSRSPIKMPDGETYVPRRRVVSYSVKCEPFIVEAERI